MHSVRGPFVLAFATVCCLPGSGLAQAAGGPGLTPAETEALQMSQEMTFVCNPQRHRAMSASESVIRREAGQLDGTASWLRTAEGTFLVLEAYDDNQAGHCMVLAWFGSELEAGSYRISRLAMTTMEDEVGVERPSFFVMGAVRSPEESSILVTEAGSVELESAEGGTLVGTFELSAVHLEGEARTDGVVWEGSFVALAADN